MRYPALLFAVVLLHAQSFLHAQASQPVFATYLGGGGNEVVGSVTIDSQGNIYIAGRTDSPDFPVKNAIQPQSHAYSQIFMSKFSSSGDLLYSTYFGGSSNDAATAIAAGPAGNIYVTGTVHSTDFPAANSFQSKFGGGVDAFVLKLDPSGNVLYATYLGGQCNDLGMGIAADAAGNAYVTGETQSPDFPVTAGAFQSQPVDYRPGATFDAAFVTKLDPAGNLVYSTHLGGGGTVGRAISVDANGQAHVAGTTTAIDFPTTPNAMQTASGRPVLSGVGGSNGFLTKFTADGSSLVYSTYLGGPLTDTARGIAIDSPGNVYITGQTTERGCPSSTNPVDIGQTTTAVSSDMPSRGIAIAPDGSIVVVNDRDAIGLAGAERRAAEPQRSLRRLPREMAAAGGNGYPQTPCCANQARHTALAPGPRPLL